MKPKSKIAGQLRPDTHVDGASKKRPANHVVKPTQDLQGAPIDESHGRGENHSAVALIADDHSCGETQRLPVIGTIRELWKNRQAWHRAEKSLTLQGKAQCRRFTGGDKTEANKLFASIEAAEDGHRVCENHTTAAISAAILPFISARVPLAKHREMIEKELARLAKTLPIYPWAKEVYGFGPQSLAAIVGECGDLSNYDTPSKLWKRMGLAVMHGQRQRRVSDAIEALEHGYSPRRRSVMFLIGGGLIGGMGRGPRLKVGEDVNARDDLSPYQKRFVILLRQEVERVTDTWDGPSHKREPVNGKESFSAHAANRIRRRIEKEFLCDLLVAWRSAMPAMKPTTTLPSELTKTTPTPTTKELSHAC